MKNITFTLLLLSCSFLAMAQDYEVAFQPAFYSQAIDCFENADGELTTYVRVTPKPGYLYKSGIVNMDDDIFQNEALLLPNNASDAYQSYSDVLSTADGNFLGLGNIVDCDIGYYPFVIKFDSNGNSIWQYDVDNFGDNYEYLDAVENDAGDFYVIRRDGMSSIIKISSEGVGLDTLHLDEYIEKIIALPNDKLLVYNEDDAYQLSDNDDELALDGLIDLPTTLDIRSIEHNGSEHLTLVIDTAIIKLNVQYEQESYIYVDWMTSATVDIDYFGENMIALIQNEDEYQLSVLDSLMAVTNSFLLSKELFEISTINYLNDELLVIGNERYYLDFPISTILGDDTVPYAQSIPFVKAYSLDGQTADITADAGVTGIFIPEAPTKEAIEWSNLSWLTFRDVEVEITNFGATTINEVAVNFRAERDATGFDIICYGYNQKSVKFDDLNLASGESIVVTIGDVFYTSMWAPDSTYQLCAWTSIPNNRLDADHSNDVGCATFELDIISSVRNAYVPDALQIYPNPAQDVLVLELDKYSESEPVSIEIWSSLGQRVRLIEGYNLGRPIDLSGLARGAYFVKMLVGDDVVGGRFLKN